jgi:pimeloyl-ACP methyl ester carboxylesterase
MYRDAAGNERPIAHMRNEVLAYYPDFAKTEWVQGFGGQLGSFEGVFSERGPDGMPRRLFDRQTGAVDPAVAKSWEKYDIRLVLERNWPALSPKLAGKLHIYVGDSDVYYLDGAVKLLKESLKGLGSDAQVVIVPGHTHGAMMSRADRRKLRDQMAAEFLRSHPEQPPVRQVK